MTYDLDEMTNLKKRLGKAGCDRAQYANVADESVPKRGTNIPNTVIDQMQGRGPSDSFCGANDIIFGMARLDHQGNKGRDVPLSTSRLYNILQIMPNINAREVKKMLNVGDRQAQKYVKACKIMMPFLEEYFDIYGDEVVVDDSFLENDV